MSSQLSRSITRACATLMLGAAVSGTAEAQRISLAPTFGVYIPTEELLKAASGAEFKQEIGLSVGGRLGISITPRLGFQATGTYVPSSLRFAFDGSEQTTDASLFFGAGKLSFFLLPLTSPVSFQLNGGIALIKRSGEAYRDLVDKTSIGGTVGAQMGFRLGPLPAIQLGVETYLYKQNVEGLTTASGEQASQKDVQLSIGFGIPLGR
ncbi:MAG: hypothetical protein H0T90_06485 [Gemmatimonadales bacterium]|nr:hypothetical protein [Gemmatimonadales bacterium]